jgi:hypothetical protein
VRELNKFNLAAMVEISRSGIVTFFFTFRKGYCTGAEYDCYRHRKNQQIGSFGKYFYMSEFVAGWQRVFLRQKRCAHSIEEYNLKIFSKKT